MRIRSALLPALAAAAVFAASGSHAAQAKTLFGKAEKLGHGTAKAYAVTRADGRPTAIGIVFTARLLDGLPAERNRTSRCFDLNKNGRIDAHGECEGDYELHLSLPPALGKRADVPVRWIALNWNPHGHPPKAWSVPHFDFHFYMADPAAVHDIRVGSCPIFIDCADRKRALMKVPTKYVPKGFVSVGATVSEMGDHLIDVNSPELAKKDPKPFTYAWVLGAYGGHVTFFEPMVTRAYLLTRPNACHAIKRPKAFERAGYYPTLYCLRYSARHKTYTVSLEGLVYRKGG